MTQQARNMSIACDLAEILAKYRTVYINGVKADAEDLATLEKYAKSGEVSLKATIKDGKIMITTEERYV